MMNTDLRKVIGGNVREYANNAGLSGYSQVRVVGSGVRALRRWIVRQVEMYFCCPTDGVNSKPLPIAAALLDIQCMFRRSDRHEVQADVD